MTSAPSHPEAGLLRERYEALSAEALAADGAELAAGVTTWRWSEPGAGAHRPEPWWRVREFVGEPGGGWLERCDGGADVDRVGFDAEGRALVVEAHRGGEVTVVETWSHGPDGSWMRRIEGAEDRVAAWVDRWIEPRSVASFGLSSFWIQDAGMVEVQQTAQTVEAWRWELGEAVEGTVTEDVAGLGVSSAEYVLVRDEIQARLVVDGSTAAWSSQPVIREERVLIDVLAAGLQRAIVAGVVASGVERPFAVEHRTGDPKLPGFVRVGGEAFRDEIRRRSPKDGAALERLRLADGDHEDRGCAMFDLADIVDDDTTRACREVEAAARMLGTGVDGDATWAIAYRTLAAVAQRLTERLNEPATFGEAAVPFLALVFVETSEPTEAGVEEHARQVLGDERIDAFFASLTSTRAKPRGRRVSVKAARTDRAKLATWLEHQGIDEGAAVAAAAEPAFRLVRPAPGASRPGTRFHGAGLLPPGTPWPKTDAGRELAFLAAIDLGELPEPLPGGPTLPNAGWLLFFADIDSNDPMVDVSPSAVEDPGDLDGEATFLGEETANVEGASARVLFVPPGVEPVDAVPPPARSGERGWPEDRRVARAELTLPTHHEANARLGIDEAIDLWDVLEPLGGSDADWILGAATGVQGHPVEDGSVLLLHLASVEFQDDGAIQFRIPPDALVVGDWSRAYAVADSG